GLSTVPRAGNRVPDRARTDHAVGPNGQRPARPDGSDLDDLRPGGVERPRPRRAELGAGDHRLEVVETGEPDEARDTELVVRAEEDAPAAHLDRRGLDARDDRVGRREAVLDRDTVGADQPQVEA